MESTKLIWNAKISSKQLKLFAGVFAKLMTNGDRLKQREEKSAHQADLTQAYLNKSISISFYSESEQCPMPNGCRLSEVKRVA